MVENKNLDERIKEQVTKKRLEEVRTVDSPNAYTKDAKVEQILSYWAKANEIMNTMNTEINGIKTIDEAIAKKETLRILNNDLREAVNGSLDSIIYNY